MTQRLLCFGLGYSARSLAERLQRRGFTIVGTCRPPAGIAALRDAGIEPLLFDGERPLAPEAFAGITHVLSSVPPDRDGDPALRLHRDWLDTLARDLSWIGYLSTTGVYGDAKAGWVD